MRNRSPRKWVGGMAFVLPLCSSILIKINYIKCCAQTDIPKVATKAKRKNLNSNENKNNNFKRWKNSERTVSVNKSLWKTHSVRSAMGMC